MEMKKNVLLIVGNGFDLNIGLQTSYNHFLSSLDIHSLSNNLIHELNKRNNTNWVDIENELESCAIDNLREINVINKKANNNEKIYKLERQEYIELKKLLKYYLKKQHVQNLLLDIDDKSSYMILSNLLKRNNINLTVLNFNYTHTIEYLFKEIEDKFSGIQNHNLTNVSKQIIYVHGKLESDIVFGINDYARVEKEHRYLHKSFDNHTTTININKLLEDNNEIIFYGYSLGNTDASYFNDFFRKICLYNDLDKDEQKRIKFYFYKDSGYIDLFDRLVYLTNCQTAKLRQYNNIQFEETFIDL